MGGFLIAKDCEAIQNSICASSASNGTNRARTYDPLLVRQVLSQLSYDPICRKVALRAGFLATAFRRRRCVLCRTHALYYHLKTKVKQFLPISLNEAVLTPRHYSW